MVKLLVEIADEDDLDFGEVDWEQTAAEQVLPEADFGDAKEGDLFAMEDRNNLAEEWPGRRVFIGMGETCVWVFDEHGVLINEPDQGVGVGHQEFDGDDGFQSKVAEGYYRFVPREEPEAQSRRTRVLRLCCSLARAS